MASPRLVICDEPTSALDLSVQAQVLNLLRTLQQDFDLSYLFISHDLAVVRHLSHRIIVLYHGRVMETGDAGSVYNNPTHPYTQALLAAAPVPDPEEQRPASGSTAPATRGQDSNLPRTLALRAPLSPHDRHLPHKPATARGDSRGDAGLLSPLA